MNRVQVNSIDVSSQPKSSSYAWVRKDALISARVTRDASGGAIFR